MTEKAAPHPAWLDDLRNLLGERASTNPNHLETHSHDESWHDPAPPDAVAFAESTAEVAEILRLCSKARVPVIPFGAGTAVEGHIQALHGGLSLDVSRLNRILEINPEDLDCRVEAGVNRVQLNRELEKHGLFFPVDPGAEATLGGMAATGASGTTTVRYGAMRENVMGLTVALPDGRVIRTGGRSRKSSAGYDLTRLFIGSEGTLGVITELQLRVQPLPEAISAASCPFATLEGAVNAVVELLQAGVPVARCELMDAASVDSVNCSAGLDLPVQPSVFFEFHGTDASVREQAAIAGGFAAENGGGEFRRAVQREDRDRIWEARHKAFYAAKAQHPGAKGWPTDVAVPVSRLAECIEATGRDIDEAKLFAPILGHIGDGNFHVLFLFQPGDKATLDRVRAVNARLIERALAMGGTCSGEHGVGCGKTAYLENEHGEAVEVMRSIKTALDPLGIMNPGKVLPPG